MRGEGAFAREAHENRFNSLSGSVDISDSVVERLPRETSSRVRQRNCQSKKTGDRLFNK